MKRVDILLLLSSLGLMLFGIFFVYSSSVNINAQIESNQFIRQLFYILFGLIIFLGINFISFEKFKTYIPFIYGFFILLLLVTTFFGQIRNGAKSWISFGPIGLQPSEFAKIGTILLYAYVLDRNRKSINTYFDIVVYGFIGLIPLMFILIQPDMGTALVYIPIMLAIYYISGTDSYKVFFIAGAGAVSIFTLVIAYYVVGKNITDPASVVLLRSNNFIIYLISLITLGVLTSIGITLNYFTRIFKALSYTSFLLLSGAGMAYAATIVLKPYQLRRLLVFVNPESDPLGSGWHILQSVAAIGSGGFFGDGFLKGQQSNLDFLPQKSTDFIYSLIGEELGFVGAGFILLLYAVLFWRIVITGFKSKSIFSKVCCAGVFAMFFTHFIVNVGMTIGIMPVTGIPLLLVSYGGSSMLTALIGIGFVHNIYFNESFKNTATVLYSAN